MARTATSEPDETGSVATTMMARLHSITGETGVRRGARLPRTGAVRDLAADWKRWSLAERVGAVTLVGSLIISTSIPYALMV